MTISSIKRGISNYDIIIPDVSQLSVSPFHIQNISSIFGVSRYVLSFNLALTPFLIMVCTCGAISSPTAGGLTSSEWYRNNSVHLYSFTSFFNILLTVNGLAKK
jgi:hypothetical protein